MTATSRHTQPAEPPVCDGSLPSSARRGERRLTVWLLAASLSYLTATAGLRWRDSLAGWLPPLLVILAAAAAAGAFLAYRVFLRQVDELRRQIEGEAMTVGYATGVLAAAFGTLLPAFGMRPLDGHGLTACMLVAAAAGQWLARRRYARPT